jgi:predicted DNA-binding transcriptional regulator YafY
MAKKHSAGPQPADVTSQRAGRLHRLVLLLAAGPQTRDYLCGQLRLDVRTFYRDLDLLRSWGIDVPLRQRRYELDMDLPAVYDLLPFPDPHLSLADALVLANGSTAAHRKLKALVAAIVGPRPKSKTKK